VDVWSVTSDYTYPPRVQGEIMTRGTLNPSPIGLPAGMPNSFIVVNSPSTVTVEIPSVLFLGGVGTQ